MAVSNRRRGIIAEINVTPLVDIMLVLLIIFMLTAHLIAKQVIEIELPRAGHATAVPPTTLAITVTRNGSLFLNDKPVTADELRASVTAVVAKDPRAQVVIAADKAVLHGQVVWIIDTVKSLGVTSFAIEISSPLPRQGLSQGSGTLPVP